MRRPFMLVATGGFLSATALEDLESMPMIGDRLQSLLSRIGLDYALFVSHESAGDHDQRQVAKSLLICAANIILAFFFMIFSTAPILKGIGLTVSIGVMLSLLSAMVVCPAPQAS